MAEQTYSLNRDRLSVLVASILLLNVLFRFISFPEVSWRLELLGSPLEVRVTTATLLVLFCISLVVTGTRSILLAHPSASQELPRPLYLSWILPGLLAGLSVSILTQVPDLRLWSGGLLLVAFLISVAIEAEFVALSPEAPHYARARLALNLLAYLLAFALFYFIYRTRARSLITATATTLTAFLLALDVLSIADVGVARVALYAGVVGLTTGESTWAFNYWRLGNWAGAFSILLVLYLTSGIAQQYLLGRLTGRVVAEFIGVAVLALALLYFAV